MLKTLIIFILCGSSILAQTDWERWEAKDISYEMNVDKHSHINENSPSFILSALKGTYSFFISDLDGDNCPYSPTCSSFFIQSVQRTNIIKGSLMFADRFMRDSNLFKSREQYKTIVRNHLFDPVDNYLLKTETVRFEIEN